MKFHKMEKYDINSGCPVLYFYVRQTKSDYKFMFGIKSECMVALKVMAVLENVFQRALCFQL